MTQAGISAILFDVDGTLLDSYRLYLESYRRALQPFLGYAPDDAELIARRPSSERHFLHAWLGEEAGAACHESMRRHYAELHQTHFEGLYDGVREMLAALRSAGIPLGVVTGKGRAAWEVTSAAADLASFEVVVTEDDMEAPKPDPGGLVSAARALGVAPEQTIYIGDSISDMDAGSAAGMRVGAALWPKTEAEDRREFITTLDGMTVDWRFERPGDVVRTFAAWC